MAQGRAGQADLACNDTVFIRTQPSGNVGEVEETSPRSMNCGSQQSPRYGGWRGSRVLDSQDGKAPPSPDARESPTPACLRVPPPGVPGSNRRPARQPSGEDRHQGPSPAPWGPVERDWSGLRGVQSGGPAGSIGDQRAPSGLAIEEGGPRAGAAGMQTVQRQHGREVLAVGDARGVGNARLPQVGPIGGGGDDRAVNGRHLPVVGGQRGGHQYPARDGDHEGDDLRSRASHAARCSPARSRAPTLRRDPRTPNPAALPLASASVHCPRPPPRPPDPAPGGARDPAHPCPGPWGAQKAGGRSPYSPPAAGQRPRAGGRPACAPLRRRAAEKSSLVGAAQVQTGTGCGQPAAPPPHHPDPALPKANSLASWLPCRSGAGKAFCVPWKDTVWQLSPRFAEL